MKGRDDEGERILRQGLAQAPQDPGIHHALGLALVRQKKMGEALEELRKAAKLPPEQARYAYVYGVALDSMGQTGRALEVLEAAHARPPGNREILSALASFSAKARNRGAASATRRNSCELDPQDPEAQRLYDQLTGKRAPGAAGSARRADPPQSRFRGRGEPL